MTAFLYQRSSMVTFGSANCSAMNGPMTLERSCVGRGWRSSCLCSRAWTRRARHAEPIQSRTPTRMADVVRDVPWRAGDADEPGVLDHEWLVTNGLGGYAAGTVAGALTRRFHGLLVAALPAPLGRMVVVSSLWERVRLPDGRVVVLSAEERGGRLELGGARLLAGLRLENGLPVWTYELERVGLEKRVLMPYRQNTVYVRYDLTHGEGPVRLSLRF